MKKPLYSIFVFGILLFLGSGFAIDAAEENPSASSREISMSNLPDHPRLYLTEARQKELQELAAKDTFLANQIDALLKNADNLKTQVPSKYEIPDGLRLLDQSRRSLYRTSTLAFAYRWTGKKEYADAAIEEMLTVCRFRDWNPKHYLDTAEMCSAVAIGYDWLYGVLDDSQRQEIRNAIQKHAFQTALPLYEKNSGWVLRDNNWNEVCNCGLTLGALAIAEDDPEMSEKILRFAIGSLPNGLKAYQPDGAYPEGPIYWSYGSSFTGLMVMALRDVFGHDFDLLKAPGLDRTGDYYMSMISPINRSFNYADCSENVAVSPMMYALSTCFDRPDYAYWQRRMIRSQGFLSGDRLSVFQAIWYNPAGTEADFANTPKARLFRGIQDVMTARTDWNDPQAAFFGFKGGNNRANHGHLDIGTFVYDVDGVRWASDLGTDDYNLPGYFGRERWNYYRLNNRSHNTLLIGDNLQNIQAISTLSDLQISDDAVVAQCDITNAYKDQAGSVVRTVTLQNDGTLIIEDQLDGVKEPVRWACVSRAKIEVDGKNATLTIGNKKRSVHLESEQADGWEALAATPPTDREKSNAGYNILGTFAKPVDGKVHFRVTFTKTR